MQTPDQSELQKKIKGLLAKKGNRGKETTIPKRQAQTSPLSLLQKQIWFHEQHFNDQKSYLMVNVLRLPGRYSASAVQQAINQIADKHGIMRTVFKEADGIPFQSHVDHIYELAVFGSSQSPCSEHDLAGVIADMSQPFDLSRAPCFRFALVNSGGEDNLLVKVCHHIASDGYSQVLFDRMLLAALANGEQASAYALPEPEAQYSDYCLWEEEQLHSDAWKKHAEFWEAHLRDYEPKDFFSSTLHRLPHTVLETKAVAPSMTLRWTVPENQTKMLKHLIQASGVTPVSGMASLIALFLHQLSQEHDVAVGIPVAGRAYKEIRNTLGLFVNIIPVRYQLSSGKETVQDFLKRSQDSLFEAFSHQQLPLSEIIKILKLARASDLRNPLLSTVINVADSSGQDNSAEYPESDDSSKFDWIWNVDIRDADIAMNIVFNPACYAEDGVRELMRLADRFLADCAAQPDTRLVNLCLASEDDLSSQLAVNARVEPAGCANLIQMFYESLAKFGHRTALSYYGEQISYGALEGEMRSIAAAINLHGSGSNVGICFKRNRHLIPAILGTMLTGRCYVPIDPDLPDERKVFIIASSRVDLVITDEHTFPTLNGIAYLDPATILNDGLTPHPMPVPDQNQNACAYFTSGTTGLPKMVLVTHANILNCLMDPALELRDVDRIAQIAPYNFDAFTFELWAGIKYGACLEIIEHDDVINHEAFKNIVQARRVTCGFFTTTLLNAYIDTIPEALGGFRCIYTGGEEADSERMHRLQRQYPGLNLYNGYGPTENTTFSTIHRLDGESSPVPIGKALVGTSAYVLDHNLNLLPRGLTGELYVSGANLTMGYHGNPRLTAERFLPNPFSAVGDRMYRTGDFSRFDAQGRIVFSGRRDEQIKLRGFRIEPGEIQAIVSRISSVKSSQLKVRKKADRSKELELFCTFASEVRSEEFLTELRRVLPHYMMPHKVYSVPRLIMKANGKFDSEATRELSRLLSREQNPADFAELSDSGLKLLEIFREFFQSTDISPYDSFFDLGGDSIQSLQIASMAKKAGLNLTSKMIFDHPTVAGMNEKLGLNSERPEPSKRLSSFGVTALQDVYLSEYLPLTSRFNLSEMMELPSGISDEQLRRALRLVFDAHPMLTAEFRKEGESWRGHYQEGIVIDFESIVIREDEDARQLVLARTESAQRSISVPDHKLFAIQSYIDQKSGRRFLFITFHHLLMDLVSWRILSGDIQQVLKELSRGNEPPALPVTADFGSYGAALGIMASSNAVRDDKEYWETQLHDDASSALARADLGSSSAYIRKSFRHNLSEKHTSGLVTLSRRLGVDVQTAVLAVLNIALTKVHGFRSTSYLLESHGRHETLTGLDLSRSIGWFTQLYPVKLQTRDQSLAASILSAAEELARVPSFGISYERLLLRPGELSKRPALSFNYLGQVSADSYAMPGDGADPYQGEIELAPDIADHISILVPISIVAMIQQGALEINVQTSQEIANFLDLHGVFKEIEDIARRSTSASEHLTEHQLHQLRPIDKTGPLTPMQKGMLFHSLESLDAGSYHNQLVFRLSGDLNLDRLKASWQQILQRYDALRTRFEWHEARGPLQLVEKFAPQDAIQVIDLSTAESGSPNTGLEEILIDADRQRHFDLQSGPLSRVMVIKLAPSDYRMIWSFHHIILDGWSKSIILNELKRLYQGEGTRMAPSSPAFVDFAKWLPMQSHDLGKIPEIYADLTSPSLLTQAKEGSSREASNFSNTLLRKASLSSELTSRLQKLARDSQVTLNTVVQAIVAMLLAKCTGRSDISFGFTVSGRGLPFAGIEAIVGNFLNTQIMRIILIDGEQKAALLRRLFDIAKNLEQVAHMPLYDFKRNFLPDCGDALFDTLLVFENYPAIGSDSFSDIVMEEMDGFDSTNYPLTIMASPGEQLELGFSFKQDCFDEPFIETLCSGFHEIAEHLCSAVEPRIQLDLWSKRQNSSVFSGKSQPQEIADQTVVELFRRSAADAPEKIAIFAETGDVSYQELNASSERIAGSLRAAGLGRGDFVGLSMPRGTGLISAILGILKAGTAYIAIPTELPYARKSFILSNCKARLLISNEPLLPGEEAPLPCDQVLFADLVSGSQVHEGLPDIGPDDAACVFYTSGSTGQPKGTILPHKAIVRLVQNSMIPSEPSSIFTQMSNFSFDIFCFDVWIPLLQGASTLIIDRDDALNPVKLKRMLSRYRVTHSCMAIALMEALVKEEPDCLALLQHLYVGGDRVEASSLAAFRAEGCRPARIYNAYGPTEATTFATVHEIDMASESRTGIPIGRPIDETEVYILDSALNIVSPGVQGEVYIGGRGLAIGYAANSRQTAQSFIPNPFATRSGDRLYRTGDIARYDEEGRIHFLNRKDGQVKIRGHRVECGEVKSAIESNFDFRWVEVMATRSPKPELVAFVTGPTLHAPDRVRDALRKVLPDYMIPRQVVHLPAIVLNENGKLDRKQLLEHAERHEHRLSELEEDWSPVEREIAAIWRAILGISQFSKHEHFFELGGHSIACLSLLARLNRQFGQSLQLKDILEHPNVAEQAILVSKPYSVSQVSSLLMSLNGHRSSRVLFLIHPSGGHCLAYRKLAQELTGSFDVYGINASGFDPGQPLYDDVDQMVARYGQEIRLAAAGREIHLGGWSLGGIIAFELLRSLQADGIIVKGLTIFDASPGSSNLEHAHKWIVGHTLPIVDVIDAQSLKSLDHPSLDHARSLDKEDSDRFLHRELQKIGEIAEEVTFQQFMLRWQVVLASNKAVLSHDLSKLKGGTPLLLFRCTQLTEVHGQTAKDRRDLGWSDNYDGPITTVDVDCDHHSIMEQACFLGGILVKAWDATKEPACADGLASLVQA